MNRQWWHAWQWSIAGTFLGALPSLVLSWKAAVGFDRGEDPIGGIYYLFLIIIGWIAGAIIGNLVGIASTNSWRVGKAWLGFIFVLCGIGLGFAAFCMLAPDHLSFRQVVIALYSSGCIGGLILPLLTKRWYCMKSFEQMPKE